MYEGFGTGLEQDSPMADQARRLFETARRLYKAGDYRKAIILFERVRHMPGVPKPEALLYNIGLANLRLKRFATAVIYFETYLASPRISASVRTEAQKLLNDAKRGAGIPVAK